MGPCEMVFMEVAEGVQTGAPRTPPSPPKPSLVVEPRPLSPRALDLRQFHLERVHVSDMAEVYKGIRQSDGLKVAIKILRSTDPYVRDKFWHTEGKIGEVLNHPNIVRIYGRLFIIMEWLDGGTLRDRLQKQAGRPLEIGWAIATIGQVCEGLSYAHSQGVIHRDVKPENIMFSGDNQSVKIVDFGIARLTEQRSQTSMGVILGTPLYMSPEQARGERADSRSDIYAVGAILYELLVGRPPFIGDPLTVAHKHIAEDPIPPRALNPAVPPHIEAAILKALQKDPRRRFRDVRHLATAIGYKPSPVIPAPTPHPGVPEGLRVAPRPSSAQASARLRILDGPLRNRTISLSQGGVVLLGRALVNPQDPQISRKHARVISLGEQFWIQDDGSTNGTFHNRLRVETKALLSPGDEIRLGQTVLRFER